MYLLTALTERPSPRFAHHRHTPQSPARTEAKMFHRFFQFTVSTLSYSIQLATPYSPSPSKFPFSIPLLSPLLRDEKKNKYTLEGVKWYQRVAREIAFYLAETKCTEKPGLSPLPS